MPRDRDDRREEERRYWGDVVYDVYRRGGNSDLVDRDWTRDRQDDGLSAEQAGARFMREHRRPDLEPEPPDVACCDHGVPYGQDCIACAEEEDEP